MDNVLSDYLWARAVLLTSPTVATCGTTIQARFRDSDEKRVSVCKDGFFFAAGTRICFRALDGPLPMPM